MMPGFVSTSWRAWPMVLGLALAVMASGCTEPPEDPLGELDIGKSLAGLGRGTSIEPAEAGAWRDELLELINDLRAEHGLWLLAEDPVLTKMAGAYAEQMIEEDFFGHHHPVTDGTVGGRARDAGYRFFKVGENLAAGHLSPQQVLDAWQASPEHRANLLDPDWEHIGIGIRAGGRYNLYFVAEFAWPQD